MKMEGEKKDAKVTLMVSSLSFVPVELSSKVRSNVSLMNNEAGQRDPSAQKKDKFSRAAYCL